MKLKVKLSYEWEVNNFQELLDEGFTFEECKISQKQSQEDAIASIDWAADNNICYPYKRDLQMDFIE